MKNMQRRIQADCGAKIASIPDWTRSTNPTAMAMTSAIGTRFRTSV